MSKEFGKTIKVLRTKAGLNKQDFAKEICSSPAMVSIWERGAAMPNLHYVIKISELFNTSIDELVKPSEMKLVSYNIQFLRQQKGYSQEGLALDLDITRSRLSSWEEHRAEPNCTFLCKISDYFQVSVDDLLKKDLRKCI